MKYKVYLAGPDVFKPNAKEHGKALVNLLDHWNMEGLYPLDNEIDTVAIEREPLGGFGPNIVANKVDIGKAIALANMEMIQRCDAVLANLEPFRGPSADVGTVWECAYAKGLGKIVCGYNAVNLDYKFKVLGKVPHDGMLVEDFGVWDNIMLVHGIDILEQSIQDALTKIKSKLDLREKQNG
jgi:nucleoside 2-deoxyribosyltransferase